MLGTRVDAWMQVYLRLKRHMDRQRARTAIDRAKHLDAETLRRILGTVRRRNTRVMSPACSQSPSCTPPCTNRPRAQSFYCNGSVHGAGPSSKPGHTAHSGFLPRDRGTDSVCPSGVVDADS